MRFLCIPGKKYYCPILTPDGVCEDLDSALAWVEARAPDRGPWTIAKLAGVIVDPPQPDLVDVVELPPLPNTVSNGDSGAWLRLMRDLENEE